MRDPVDALEDRLPVESTTRYDLVLAAIPSAFVVAVLVGHVLSVPPRSAVAAAALVGALVLADALFVNPPRGQAG